MSETVTVEGIVYQLGSDDLGEAMQANKYGLMRMWALDSSENRLLRALLASEQRANQAEEDVRWLFDYGPGVPNYTSPPDYRKHLDEIRARHPQRKD